MQEPTKPNDLPPIPATPMAIERRMPRAGTHLSCRNGCRIGVSPSGLDVFSVSAANAWPVVERILGVTTRSMRREVELWNKEFQRKLVLRNPELFGVALYSLVQLYRPTACDIVRNFDVLDLLIFYRG